MYYVYFEQEEFKDDFAIKSALNILDVNTAKEMEQHQDFH